MKKTLNFFLDYRSLLLLIYLLLVQYFFLKGIFSSYRFSDKKYIYEYAELFSNAFVYIGLILSLLYPLIVYLNSKEKFKSNLVFVFIGFLPALYHIVLLILTITLN